MTPPSEYRAAHARHACVTDDVVAVSDPMSDYRETHDGIPQWAIKCGMCWDEGWVRLFGKRDDLARHFASYHVFGARPPSAPERVAS